MEDVWHANLTCRGHPHVPGNISSFDLDPSMTAGQGRKILWFGEFRCLTGSRLCSLLLRNYSTDFSNDDTNQLQGSYRTGKTGKTGKIKSVREMSGNFLAPPAERQRSFSNTDLSVVRLSVCLSVRPSVCPSVKIEGGRGLSQKRFSNFSSFLAWSFFWVT